MTIMIANNELIAEAEAHFMLEHADQQGLQDQFIVRDLIDALRAAEAKAAELDQAWLNAEGVIEDLKAELRITQAKLAETRTFWAAEADGVRKVEAENARLRKFAELAEAFSKSWYRTMTQEDLTSFGDAARRALGGEP